MASRKIIKGAKGTGVLTAETYKVGYKKGNDAWIAIDELEFTIPLGRTAAGNIEIGLTEQDVE